MNVGNIERVTQNRVVKLFKDKLNYDYLGNWESHTDNSNIMEGLLRQNLDARGYRSALIDKAIDELRRINENYDDNLYTVNKEMYSKLRYGVQVKADIGEQNETVELIDWKNPDANHFAIAEEVTVFGNREKRPDIVLYVNGIALGVLELKRSTVSVGEGIRQNITNQKPEFIQHFFNTVQFVFAGNDTEGLRYGTTGTYEKYFLKWKEESDVENLLDKYLLKLCDKERFLDIIYDFIIFDGGKKKICRPHQYFGGKAAQETLKQREGGIIWHTQGSGKSLVMVSLAKWIFEHNPNARVAIITDRDELDKQIERVFKDTGEEIYRTKSGVDLIGKLEEPSPRLLCSLIHKFHKKDVDDFAEYIKQIKDSPSKTVGDIYVFVDECHRTQSGKLNKVMKAVLRNAIFVGFTGTPLLKKDKETTLEVFGKYIHTYKFDEAVEDGVVKDLVYEARDINQIISSQEKIDEWFEVKTKGLNDYQKSELKKKWGTKQKVSSSRSRMGRIVFDVSYDFNMKPRLSSGSGNAILVAGNIYEACRYYELFQDTNLKGKCGLITSYNPSTRDITTEDTGENTETEKQFIYDTYTKLLNGKNTEKYEDETKKLFINEPATMRLLIVVDKLLTGFDAPPCSYLYIDKPMQDHGLFQAICRVNRLHTDDKLYGYIVDYKDLFQSVEGAIAVYTSELEYDAFEQKDVDVLLENRLKKGKQLLDDALEEMEILTEPVEMPKETLSYIRYFCGNPENEEDLKETELRRTSFYKHTASLIRAYVNISDDMEQAGYSTQESKHIKETVNNYANLREEIKKASGETIDLKTYESDMRYLIDNFIEAEPSRRIDPFEDKTLIEIIVESGISEAINHLPQGIRKNEQSIAETIANNVRRKIIKDHLIDPAYFQQMSKLLQEIIHERNSNAISYQKYLSKIADLANRITKRGNDDLPKSLVTKPQKALYNNLNNNEELALKIDEAVLRVKKADWRGDDKKELEIKQAINKELNDEEETNRIFQIIAKQDEY